MRPIAFKIAEGYVEVSVKYDRRRIVQAAKNQGENAGNSFAGSFRRATSRRSLWDARQLQRDVTSSFRNSGTEAGNTFSRNVMNSKNRKVVSDKFNMVGRQSGAAFVQGMDRNMSQRAAQIGQKHARAYGTSFNREASKTHREFFSGFKQAMRRNVSLSVGGLLTILAAVAAAAPALGTAIAGALTIGFAGGIGSIGIITAAQTERVKDAFSDLKESVAADLREMSEPMEGFLVALSTQLQGAFDDLAPSLETALADMAMPMERFTQDILDGFSTWGPTIEGSASAFDALMGALGPRLRDTIEDIGEALTEMFRVVEENPEVVADVLNFIVRLILHAINAVTWLTEKWVALVDAWNAEGSVLKSTVMGIVTFIGGLFSGLWKIMSGAISSIGTLISTLFTFIRDLAVGIYNVITGLLQFNFSQVWEGIRGIGSAVIDLIVGVFTGLWQFVQGIALAIWELIKATFEAFGGNAASFFTGLWEIVTTAFSQLWTIISGWAINIWTGIVGIFRGLWQGIVWVMSMIWNAVATPFVSLYNFLVGNSIIPDMVNAIMGWWNALKNWGAAVWNAITGKIRQAWDAVWSGLRWAWNAFRTWIGETWTVFRNWVAGLWNSITGGIRNRWNSMLRFVRNKWSAFRVWIGEKWQVFKNWVLGLWNSIKNGVSNRWNAMIRFIRNKWNAFRRWLGEKWNAFKNWVLNLWNQIKNGVINRWDALRDRLQRIWQNAKVWLFNKTNQIKNGIIRKFNDFKDAVIEAFRRAKDGIGKTWRELKKLAKKPVNFVITTVYNKGIRKFWNAIADKIGLSNLPKLDRLARGGILPGNSSYRDGDNRLVAMRDGEGVYVSEAMRDPYERARLHAVNKAAMQGKSLKGIQAMDQAQSRNQLQKRALTNGIPLNAQKGQQSNQGGNPRGFALGGILGTIRDKASQAWDTIAGNLRGWAGGPLNNLVDAMGNRFSKNGVEGLPFRLVKKMVQNVLSFFQSQDDAYLGGGDWTGGSARLKKALAWAKSQSGKPYQWGGVGNPSYDCSGFIGAIQRFLMGQNPKGGRLYTTHAFTGSSSPRGWKKNARSPFEVGVTNAGVGHMAGSLLGVNVESSGGAGVRVGGGARGAGHSMFNNRFGWMPVADEATLVGGGGGGSRRWRSVVEQVLGQLGIGRGHVANILRAIQKESGGNPRAVNNWDSNARRGTPSKGLLQTIGPTFNAFAGRYRNRGIFDPFANIYAAVRYARNRYGRGWSARMAAPGGYAGGGVMKPGEFSWVGENGPELIRPGRTPLHVTSNEDSMAAANGGGDIYIYGDVVLDARSVETIKTAEDLFKELRSTSRKHGRNK